jgi:hypothetical protein
VHEEFHEVGEALAGEETLTGTAASKGCWIEAHRKQSGTLTATVRLRGRNEAWNNWIQVGVVEGWWRAGVGTFVRPVQIAKP